MKNYTYQFELKNLIIQFMRVLDDCVIKRYDENNDPKQDVSVKVVYSPKTRTLQNLVNKQQNLELPVMSVSIGGISRSPKRVFNKIDGPTFVDEAVMNPKQPVPIDVTINVSILTKYQSDMDQIVSNIIPYFDPYVIISWKHPEMSQEIRSKVTWNGNLNYTYPNELQATSSYRQSIDTTFTIEGWLFKKSESNSGIIHTVIADYIGVKDLSDIEREYFSIDQYDRFITSGIPVISKVVPEYLKKNEYTTLQLYGKMLDKADSVYISGNSLTVSSQYIDAFSTNAKLSADNPPFYGVSVSEWDSTVEGIMSIELAPLVNSGLINVIVLNQAGYGSVIKNAKTTDIWKNGIFVV